MLRIRIEVILSNEEETELKKWRRQRATDSRLQFRAGLILDCAHGLPVRQIAQRYQTSERTVSRWRRRFADERLAGLMVIRASGVRENARISEGRKAVAGKIGRAKVVLADVGKAVAKKAADVGDMIGDTGVAGAKNAANVPGMIADASVSVAKKAGDVGHVVAGAGQAIATKAVNIGEVAVDAGITGAKRAADVGGVVVDAGHAGAKIALNAAIFGAQAMQVGFRRTLDAIVPVANWLSATAQGLLASSLADDLNGLLQTTVKGTPTIYDKAMDAEYGPAGVALLVGLVAGILASKATENIDLAELRDFVTEHTATVAKEVKEMAARGREWWPKVTARGLQFYWRPIGEAI